MFWRVVLTKPTSAGFILLRLNLEFVKIKFGKIIVITNLLLSKNKIE